MLYLQEHINMDARLQSFSRLLEIMDKLRAECPWDKVQTNESLRHLTIEEMYELGDAILNNDDREIMKELGDLLLHIVFYAKIGEEKNAFDIRDVIENINEKLIRRHPHIYSDVKVSDQQDVKNNWEKIKLKEGRSSVLEGVPNGLPALVKAYRIQDKVKGVGFEWEHKSQVWDKICEEMDELQAEILSESTHDRLEDEFGDVLFALVNYARYIGVNPEDALERTNKKFIGRFKWMENQAKERGLKLQEMTLSEMDDLWNQAKLSGIK